MSTITLHQDRLAKLIADLAVRRVVLLNQAAEIESVMRQLAETVDAEWARNAILDSLDSQ